MFKYSVSVKWSDKDTGFIAFVPELEGLSAFGETQDEAVKELLVAAEMYMESLNESGREIPAPNKVASYSGQLRLRMPKWLHAKMAMEAENEDVSLNTHLVSLLANRHGERETINVFIERLIEGAKDVFQASSYKVGGKKGWANNTTTVETAEDHKSPAKDLYIIAGGKNS